MIIISQMLLKLLLYAVIACWTVKKVVFLLRDPIKQC